MESYLALAKSTRGAGAAALVRQATAHPGLFTFGELLAARSIAELEGTEHAGALALLRLFSYGTYADYRANRAAYPELGTEQLAKLKQLSIVTLAERQKLLPYDLLLHELDVPNVRALEDLVIDAVYQGVILAKLDQRARAIDIERTIGRDLRPGELDEIAACLEDWSARAGRALERIDQNAQRITALMVKGEGEREAFEAEVEKQRSRSAKRPDVGGDERFGGAGDYSSQEYHDEDSRSRGGKGAKMPKNASSRRASQRS